MTPDAWMRSVFSVQAVNKGGVIRRSLRDIDKMAGRDAFLTEIRRRGFQAMTNAGQMVIFCNQEPVHLLTAGTIRDRIADDVSTHRPPKGGSIR
ncbi:MAG: hypothetical protein OIF47_03835 [Marinibacterium sp.]|nr:hypothetical protein [Marinibacterium sp.]